MPRPTPLATSFFLTAVLLAVVPAATAAAQDSPPPSESPAPSSSGPDLSGLAGEISKAISGAFDAAIKGAADQFWTTFNQTLPKLVVDSFFTFINRIATWIYDGLTELLRTLNIVTQTPLDLTLVGLAKVQSVLSDVTLMALAALVLVVALIGFGVMSRTALGDTYPELLEMFPRLIIGVLWIVAFPLLMREALNLVNALCNAIMGATGSIALPGAGAFQGAGNDAGTQPQAGEQALALLVFALAGVFLFIQSLIRVAVLNFAIVLAPFALLCWMLPQWYWLYSIWMRVLVATFLTQILQTLAIALGSALLGGMLGKVGDSGPVATLLAASMGLATVLAAWSLPKQVVGAYGPSLGLPKMLLAAAATGAAVARGVSAVGGASSAAGAAGVAGAAAAARGITSIVPIPPPPAGAPLSALQSTAVPAFPGSIPTFPG